MTRSNPKPTISLLQSLFLIWFLALLHGFCGIQASAAVSQSSAPTNDVGPLILTDADDGRMIDLHVGDQFIVRLRESPTTGFTWAFTGGGDGFMLLNSDYAQPASNTVGGGGLRSFRILARKPGSATLVLKLFRSWEGEASAAASFSIDIRVKEE